MAVRKGPILRELEQEWAAAIASLPREELARPAWLVEMGAPMPWRPAALYAELEDVRREWRELREWPALHIHANDKVNPGWTYKDLLAHLASWAEEFAREVSGVAQGSEFDYEISFEPDVGPTDWNAREVARLGPLTLDAVLDQYDQATLHLQDLVFEIPHDRMIHEARFPICMGPEPLKGSIPRIVVMKCFHDRYHFAQIRKRLPELEMSNRGKGN